MDPNDSLCARNNFTRAGNDKGEGGQHVNRNEVETVEIVDVSLSES